MQLHEYTPVDERSPALRPDFRIYTASLAPVSEERPTVVRMTGSSTEQDVQRNRMSVDALKQMAQPAMVGMNIFLNHKYELPHDLYGKLVATPEVVATNGFIDVNLVVETDMRNPPAAQTLQQIHDGHKHGCSIGCMVNKWDFANEDEDPNKDPIVINSITPIEWSVVGIPANRRCWVENAVQGKFLRTLEEGDYDQALLLAPTMKSLFSYDFDRAVLRLSATERRAFEAVKPRQTPDKQLFWQPQRAVFVMQAGNGQYRDLSRAEVVTMLQASWGKDAEALIPQTKNDTAGDTMKKKLVAADGDTLTPEQQLAAELAETDGAATPDVTLAAQGDGTQVSTPGSTAPAAGFNNPPDNRPGGGSGAVPIAPPNDAGGNTGRANNAGSTNTSPTGQPPNVTGGKVASVPVGTDAEPSNVIGGTPHRAASPDLDLLAKYNKLGKKLGLGTVDGYGMRSDGLSMTAETAPDDLAKYLKNLKKQGLQLVYAADSLALQLGVKMPNLTFKVEPDIELAGKGRVTAPLDVAHAVHVQSIASHANAVLVNSGYTTQSATPVTTTGAGTDLTASTSPSTEVKRQLAEAELRVLQLNAQIDQLQGRGLGRPTNFVGRAAPAGFDMNPVKVEMQTPEELQQGTFIIKRAHDGVKCRQWPDGHGIHQRPRLSNDQMSIMSPTEIGRYVAGQEVLVPMIFEGD